MTARSTLLFAGALVAGQALAQQPASGSTPPLLRHEDTATLTANARAVLLDIVVVDRKGNAVKGLTAGDFSLMEDGQAQRINSFREHSGPDAGAPGAKPHKLPPNTFTNFVPAGGSDAYTVILLDALNNGPATQAYVREQVIAYMKTVPPGHPIAIFQLGTRMRLVQGFSSDPAVLLHAVEGKRDSIRLPLIPTHDGSYVAQRFRQESLSDGLRAMGSYLAGFPGRKNLVWFSGSVPRSVYGGGVGDPFPDTEDFSSEIAGATDALAVSRVAVYPIDARGLQTNPAFSAERAGPAFSRTGAPSLSFEARQFYDHSELEEVANATGGKAFYNTNGLKQALREVVEDGANFYTVAYTPKNKNWNGDYREIKVELGAAASAGVQNARLEYRHGYYARAETTQQRRRVAALKRAASTKQAAAQSEWTGGTLIPLGPRSRFEDAMQLGAIPPTELVFNASVTAGTEVHKLRKADPLPSGNYLRADLHTKPFRNYQVLYAVAPGFIHLPVSADGRYRGALQFVAVLYNGQGEQVNSASSDFTIDMSPAEYSKMAKGWLGTVQAVAVPAKGTYFLRFGVHDPEANKTGAMEVAIDQVEPGVAGAGQTLVP